MIRTYIFNEVKNTWVEENENLLYYDICAFLDEENKIIYLWSGPKSTKDRYKKSVASLQDLISNFPNINFQINALASYIPSFVQEKLDIMLKDIKKEEEIEKYKFSKFTTIRFYFIFLLISISLPIISLINLSSFLSWNTSNNNFAVNADVYQKWYSFSNLLMGITLIVFILCLTIGIYEIEHQVIIFSLIGLIICIGIVLYLQQGVFIFLFQEGSTASTYLIKKEDLMLFFLLNLIGISIFEVPNILKFLVFIKTYRKYIF
ncbi:MAG: hypothetical protein ACFE85_09785 [Candidatus Hodarchaeota archaeon]